MPAPTKRRRVSYYLSLPVVIAVVFLLVAKLVAMQRAEIIAELSDRVEHRDPEDASAAVRQLGDMPRAPAAVLVAAATTADRKVAQEAQQAIGRQLRRAQQQLDAGRGAKTVSRQLTDLARELADHRHTFAVADQAWLVNTTQRILRLANQVPQKHAPAVAANCDLILVSARTATATAESAVPSRLDGQSMPSNGNATADKMPQANAVPDGDSLPDFGSTDALVAPWRADSSRPVFRPLPSATNSAPNYAIPSQLAPSSSAPPELPPDVEMIGRPMAQLDTRALLQKWSETKGVELTVSEQQLLKQRGFDRLTAPLVQKLFSTPQHRLELVDDVLKEPGVNARPWLGLLAQDEDADVRLAAVTVMATSTDPVLVEQAWQAAIHDRDPRVAALASRLRERRAAIQRR